MYSYLDIDFIIRKVTVQIHSFNFNPSAVITSFDLSGQNQCFWQDGIFLGPKEKDNLIAHLLAKLGKLVILIAIDFFLTKFHRGVFFSRIWGHFPC